jgi:hypothetical protein
MNTTVLDGIFNFLKAHWGVIALVGVLGVGYGWFHHQQALNVVAIAQINASNQVEINAINKARADEEAQHAQEQQALQSSLAAAQQQFEQASAALAVKQHVEQTTIAKQYANDPVGLAQLVATKFGFVVQMPAVTK